MSEEISRGMPWSSLKELLRTYKRLSQLRVEVAFKTVAPAVMQQSYEKRYKKMTITNLEDLQARIVHITVIYTSP